MKLMLHDSSDDSEIAADGDDDDENDGEAEVFSTELDVHDVENDLFFFNKQSYNIVKILFTCVFNFF